MHKESSLSERMRGQRGVALVMALFIVVMLLLISLAVLANANNSASGAWSIQAKNQTFDAAESGMNEAQVQLDEANTAADGTSGTRTVNGYTYTWEIVSNNLSGTAAKTNVVDPNPYQTNTITVPAGQAYIAGFANAVTGGRTVYVEEMVVPGPPTTLGKGAITCGGTAIVSHQQIVDTSGNHGAHIRCGTIDSSGGGQVPDGNSYATGSTNQITGHDGHAWVDQSPPSFLSASQLAAIQANVLAQAQKSGNYYNSGNVSGTMNIGASGCQYAYIAGNITLSGNATINNYCTTTVVLGNITISGNPQYNALPTTTAHIIYVFGTSGATLNGTPTTWGFVYAANGDVTINGGGNGTFNGAVYTPHNVTMNGGGNAGWNYNGNLSPPSQPNPNVVPEAQWEY